MESFPFRLKVEEATVADCIQLTEQFGPLNAVTFYERRIMIGVNKSVQVETDNLFLISSSV